MKSLIGLAVALPLFVLVAPALAEGVLKPQGMDGVSSAAEALEDYRCGDDAPSPECAAVSFFLCVNGHDYGHCNRIGISVRKMKNYLSQGRYYFHPPEDTFLAFEKTVRSGEGGLPEWMKPRAAFLWVGLVQPKSENNPPTHREFQEAAKREFQGLPVYEFGYALVFRQHGQQWHLARWNPGWPDGCMSDPTLKYANPMCEVYASDQDDMDIRHVFFDD